MASSPPVLDLVSANCLEFTLAAAAKPVSDEIAKQVTARMQETACDQMSRVGTVARYASLHANGNPAVSVGSIVDGTDDDGPKFGAAIALSQVEDGMPPPPDTWKPFSELFEVVTLLGTLDLRCEAEYVHELSPSLQSRIDLPSPLLIGRPDDYYGFTHIDSAILSKREGSAVEHSVEVKSGDGRISHTVRFLAGMDLNEDVVRDIFDVSTRLSKTLLYSTGEEE